MSAAAAFDLATMKSGTKLGVIITGSGTSQNNHGTATPFNNTGAALKGKLILVQPDVECWIWWGTVNSVAATVSTTGDSFHLAAYEPKSIFMDPSAGHGWIAVIGSGVVNLKVWEQPI